MLSNTPLRTELNAREGTGGANPPANVTLAGVLPDKEKMRKSDQISKFGKHTSYVFVFE